MATSNNPISNLITIATFGGQSKYAADFQTVLSRAVQLRSLNLQMMQQQQQTQTDRQTALQSLDTTLTNLQSAVTNLTSATGLAALAGSVSNSSVANISLSDGAVPATYTLEVQSLGSPAQALSSVGATVSDPGSQGLSSSSSYTLTVGGATSTITPTSNTLQGLVNAINADSSLGVSASIVNVAGAGSTPDYRLTLQGTTLATQDIQLNDGSQDLLTQMAPGAPASYKVNGYGSWITSNSDTITLSPGVTANLTGTNAGSPTTVTVQQNTTHAMMALAENPSQRDWLMEDFDGRIAMATEEFVRWSSPVLQFARFVTEDTEINRQPVSAGDKVGLFYCSANRDEIGLRRPGCVRPAARAQPHLGFGGGGPHFCLGSQLAKAELRNLFRELLTRLTTVEFGEPDLLYSSFVTASSGSRPTSGRSDHAGRSRSRQVHRTRHLRVDRRGCVPR